MPKSRLLSTATTLACGSPSSCILLELDAFLEIDQVQINFIRPILQHQTQDDGVEEVGLARSCPAADESRIRVRREHQCGDLGGAATTESGHQPIEGIILPPGFGVIGVRDHRRRPGTAADTSLPGAIRELGHIGGRHPDVLRGMQSPLHVCQQQGRRCRFGWCERPKPPVDVDIADVRGGGPMQRQPKMTDHVRVADP